MTGFFFPFDDSSATVARASHLDSKELASVTREDVDANTAEGLLFARSEKCQWQSSLLRQRLSDLALVAVVKSSDLRNHNDAPAFRCLNRSRLRGVLGQCEMSSGVLVVDKVTL